MDYKLLADEILAKLLKADDETAYKEIYTRYWKPLFQSAYYRLGTKEAAKELVQNVFLYVWENRKTNTISNLPQYLQTAIKNRVINYIESLQVQKKYQQYARENFSLQTSETEATVQYNEFYLAFEKALQQLPQKTREVFKMSRFENISVKEIARHFNISEKAVEYHITTSLKFLRLSLKDFMLHSVLLLTASQY
jgi:RNA polymerase sigma-70 factor (family 1)